MIHPTSVTPARNVHRDKQSCSEERAGFFLPFALLALLALLDNGHLISEYIYPDFFKHLQSPTVKATACTRRLLLVFQCRNDIIGSAYLKSWDIAACIRLSNGFTN